MAHSSYCAGLAVGQPRQSEYVRLEAGIMPAMMTETTKTRHNTKATWARTKAADYDRQALAMPRVAPGDWRSAGRTRTGADRFRREAARYRRLAARLEIAGL